MQFIDLVTQQQRIRKKLDERISSVLNHGKYVMGPEIKELEEKLSGYVGTKYGIGCASGTDALLISLLAYGVGPGDAVFTSPFTFIATTEVISLLGATPVFVDIDPGTFNIDPSKLELAIKAVKEHDPSIYPLPSALNLEPRTSNLLPRGIIAVDLFGLPADYDRINEIAKNNKLFVIEDAAQSFGATYKGRKASSLGDIGCTSFFPAKPLGCYGDGGMCFTNNDQLADLMRSIRVHGKGHDKYDNVHVGINGRLDTMQAAILLAKFEIFPEEVNLRQDVANRFEQLLGNSPDLIFIPRIPESYTSVWAQYSILARDEQHRSALQERLKEAGIPTAIYYPKPLHLQTVYTFLGYEEGDFTVSENCATRIFSLPMHPYLDDTMQRQIAEAMIQG